MNKITKRYPKRLFLIALITVSFLAGCEKALLGEAPESDPQNTLAHMYAQFEQHYGLFKTKNINWQAIYQNSKPGLSKNSTQRELYNTMVTMLTPLNDAHVTLYPSVDSGLPTWSSDLDANGRFINDFFDLQTIKKGYCANMKSKGIYDYGMIGEIGYLHISEFPSVAFSAEGKILDEIFEVLESSKGLIVDIRDNAGGADPMAQYIAGKFAKHSSLYMKSKKKVGRGENDFSDWAYWTVNPQSGNYTKPIALMTEKGTQSAAETLTFTLAMRTQSHIKTFGGKTAGAFSDNILKELPNGWLVSISVGDYRDQNGVSYEGTGITPNVSVTAIRSELKAGRDRALEAATDYLNNL